MRVLVSPGKFKGTLTARQAAQAIARGWKRVRPDDTIDLLPMSDGGDGFGAAMRDLAHSRVEPYRLSRPNTRKSLQSGGQDDEQESRSDNSRARSLRDYAP